MQDITKYTIERVLEHLILIEDHIANWEKEEICKPCVKFKHRIALAGYQRECADVCEYPLLWNQLNNFIKELDTIKITSDKEAGAWKNKIRNLRKQFEESLSKQPRSESDIGQRRVKGVIMEKEIGQKEKNGMSMVGLAALAILGFYLYRKYFKVQLSGVPVNLGQVKPRVYVSSQERRILGTIRKRIE